MRTLIIFLAMLLSGCTQSFNNEFATYKKLNDSYVLKVTGMRENMAHDPISYIFRGSHEASESFEIPRITGVIKGCEIPVPEGYYKLLGDITFDGDYVTIDLSYDNYDNKTQPKLNWNGKYILKAE